MTFLSGGSDSISSSTNNTTANVGGLTTLTNTLLQGASSMDITSSAEFPTSGTVKINDEYITYTGKSAQL